jgi:lipopolysaccharide transport system ATP-binding protein
VSAVEVQNVSKGYSLHSSAGARFRQLVFARRVAPEDRFWAVKDVSFNVQKGEVFGIVGANGSGKSTLLQIIAGILRPTSGTVNVNGRLAALLELGSGFNPEFTGRENIRLNASILGLVQSDIKQRMSAIEHFAGIGTFIDQPIRTYSSGMVLRLAFAVSAHVDPDVLIVDEALAVGDIAFRQRCMRRIHELRGKGTTILFVSHDTGDVKALCDRCLWMRDGSMETVGPADPVIAQYLTAMFRKGAGSRKDRRTSSVVQPRQAPEVVEGIGGRHRYGDLAATLTGLRLVTSAGIALETLQHGEPVVLRISLRVNTDITSPIVGFLVRNERGETIFGSNTARENYPLPFMVAEDTHTVDFHWDVPELAPGPYTISVAISSGTLDEFTVCDYVEDALNITVEPGTRPVHGYFRLACSSVVVRSF